MRTCALIPAFNEVPYIADVVKGTQPHVEKVVVIDDGSGDGTGQVARAAGAICLRSPRNCGKASALRIGIDFARAQNFTHVITLDGDGQHLPEDIPGMLRVAEETGADSGDWGALVRSRVDATRPVIIPTRLAAGWRRRWWAARSATARAGSGCSGWINSMAPNCGAGTTN